MRVTVDPKLKAYWYQRLKESGFKDIERESGRLRDEVDERTIKRALQDKERREAYYAACAQFLFTFDFTCERARKVWELHSDGLSVRAIAREMDMKRPTVHVWIKRFRKLAGIR